MKKEEKKEALLTVAKLKKELMMMRIKKSSGEPAIAKEFKQKKKEIARLFTNINKKVST